MIIAYLSINIIIITTAKNCIIYDNNVIMRFYVFHFCLLLQKERIMIIQTKLLENRSNLVCLVTNQFKMVAFS